MTSSRRIGTAGLLLLPALLLAGCSSTSTSSSGAGGAQASAKAIASAVASAQGKTAPAASGPITTGDQLCKLVSVADAQAAVASSPVFTQSLSSSGPDDEPGCGYTDAKNTVILSVFLFPLKDNPFNGTKPIMSGDTMKPVPGLGEKAGVNKDEIDVLKGQTVLSIETVGDKDLTEAQLIAAGKLFTSRLPG